MLSIKLLYKSPFSALLTGWKTKKKRKVMRALEDPDLETNPMKLEYVKSIPEAQLYRGILLQGYLVPADFLEELDEMPIRDDDVFIITYPKSGTTWTEEIVSLIYKGGDIRQVEKKLLIYRVHHLEVCPPYGYSRFLRKLLSPRLMATHLPLALLPKELRNPKCKIIYVMRNPKDTAVSYYHHHKMSSFLGNASYSWDTFLSHFMAGHVVYGSWFDHVLQYWEFCKAYPDNVFFLCYEELKLDLSGMVRRLSEFLQRPLTDKAVEDIVNHCSFESMKKNKMVNREVLPISDLFDMTKSKFMRKGIIGDWKTHFSEEQSNDFNQLCQSRLDGSDLPIVFELEEANSLIQQFGRIIYNAPERSLLKVLDDESKEDYDDTNDNKLNFEETDFADQFSWLPQLQLHLQPDPLTLDAVG